MILPGWFPAGAARVVPQFNLVEADVDSGDASFYQRTFSIPNVRPDRYIVVLSATGKNSGTSVITGETLGGTAAVGVNQQVGKCIGSVVYKHVPAGTTIQYQLNLDSTQSSWAFACFELWGLGGPQVNTRQGVGNLLVPANGLLFTAAAGDNPFTLTGQTLLSSSPGSDVEKNTAYKSDFRSETTFNVASSDTTAPFALAALSIR
jgi:hypothetical protein